MRLESGRTYTAVLETRGQKSFQGRKGISLSCCPIADSFTSLIVNYTKASQDELGERWATYSSFNLTETNFRVVPD